MRISDWSSDVCSSDLLGLKRDWHFGGAFLQTNVALFRSKYSNVQRQVVDTTTDNPFTVMVNAAEATIQGIELEATFRPIERFTLRSEEHTSELQSLMRISYAVFCLKNKKSKQSHY